MAKSDDKRSRDGETPGRRPDDGSKPTLPAQGITLSFDEIKELLRSSRLSVEEQAQLIELQAEANAKATKRALRPENERHPAKSVFSHPEGDVERPRKFECKMFWVGGRLDTDTSTAEEIALLHQLSPGVYLCTKGDGSKIKVGVIDRYNEANGKLEQREVWFQTRGEARHNLRSQADMCREMIAQAAAERETPVGASA